MRDSIIWLLVIVSSAYAESSLLETVYEWKQIDYAWKSKEQKADYVAKNLYIPEIMTPVDVEVTPDGNTTFVTVAKKIGVPATLNKVSKEKDPLMGHLLEPYPDWSWYDPKNLCKGIVNVYRVAIDACNRLWVLDTGSVSGKQECPAKLLAFNLDTNKLILQDVFNNSIVWPTNETGLLVTPVVKLRGQSCRNPTVYIADAVGNAILIWQAGKSLTRVEDEMFKPNDNYTTYHIAGESFSSKNSIMGMALSPKMNNASQFLAFRPLSSTDVLLARARDSSIFPMKASNVLPSQATAMAFSSQGTLFYGLTEQIAIGCWNINRPMTKDNFIIALTDQDRLQFVSGMKIKIKDNKEYVYMMSNRLQKSYNKSLQPTEVNFRITRAPVEDLIKGTVCDK